MAILILRKSKGPETFPLNKVANKIIQPLETSEIHKRDRCDNVFERHNAAHTSSEETMPPHKETERSTPHKRPRPVQSCIICRRQKIKCNRQQPCAQCSKCDRADQCVYRERNLVDRGGERGKSPVIRVAEETRPDAANTSVGISSSPTVRAFSSDPITDLQSRVRRLENRGQNGHSNGNTGRQHRPGNQVSTTGRRYHGLNDNTRSIDLVCFEYPFLPWQDDYSYCQE
jgi:hypothetical protein